MDITKFKEAEEKYRGLKEQLDNGEISAAELKTKLKDTMIQDDDGQYWMIGGKSGKWYRYDGTEWSEAEPYQQEAVETQQYFPDSGDDREAAVEEAAPAEPVGAETTAEPEEAEARREIFTLEPADDTAAQDQISAPDAEETSRLQEEPEREEEVVQPRDEPTLKVCKFCMSRIAPHSPFCQFCGGSQKEGKSSTAGKTLAGEGEMLIKSIKLVPMIFFLGGLGLIIGVLFGATFGIFNILGDAIYQFPIMLQETRGKIQGGLIFAAMGGIAGFVAFSLVSVVITGIYNALSFFFGGIRLKIKS